jgi:hypothetical protein
MDGREYNILWKDEEEVDILAVKIIKFGIMTVKVSEGDGIRNYEDTKTNW